MERNIQRINGIKMDVGRLTDDELEANMGYAHGRADAASAELETLGVESARRFAEADTQEFEPVAPENPRQLRLVDWGYMREMGHVAGNPFYGTDPQPPAA
jgi:hypothetical protein